jgi:hypothetical protein
MRPVSKIRFHTDGLCPIVTATHIDFGPPMTLGNMHEQGVHHLIAFCRNDACRHQAVIDVS